MLTWWCWCSLTLMTGWDSMYSNILTRVRLMSLSVCILIYSALLEAIEACVVRWHFIVLFEVLTFWSSYCHLQNTLEDKLNKAEGKLNVKLDCLAGILLCFLLKCDSLATAGLSEPNISLITSCDQLTATLCNQV